MMDECRSVLRQHSGNFSNVNPEGLSVGVHQGIEAEYEIDGRILCDRNRPTVILYDHDVRRIGEAVSAGIHARR
jgi:hypothetical protein